MRLLPIIFLLAACQPTEHALLQTADSYHGFNETQHRNVLKKYVGVDPKRTEWCAAFVNAVLKESNMTNLHDINHVAPLMARSFLDWGEPVDIPQPGDVVVFPRGNSNWKGHVGFYVGWQRTKDGKVYWKILGGNQKDSVSIDLYRSTKALGIRRHKYGYGQEFRNND